MGLNHGAGFRLTEIRVWACERTAEDTPSMPVYEYLTCAEAKKKVKVKISNKKSTTNFKGGFGTKGGLGPLGPGGATKAGGPGHAGADQERRHALPMSKGFSLAPQRAKVAPVSGIEASHVPPPRRIDGPSQPLDIFPAAMEPTQAKDDGRQDSPATPAAMAEAAADFVAAFGGLGGDAAAPFPLKVPPSRLPEVSATKEKCTRTTSLSRMGTKTSRTCPPRCGTRRSRCRSRSGRRRRPR
jgi:hypothetical protein